MDLDDWLKLWSKLIHGSMGMQNFPVWLRLLPKSLFRIIDRDGRLMMHPFERITDKGGRLTTNPRIESSVDNKSQIRIIDRDGRLTIYYKIEL